MKFPYGISDFEKIATNGYFYIDRMDRIPLLEEAGEYLLFIRPRRFGKSLLLSTSKTRRPRQWRDPHYPSSGHPNRSRSIFARPSNSTPSASSNPR